MPIAIPVEGGIIVLVGPALLFVGFGSVLYHLIMNHIRKGAKNAKEE